MIITTLTQLRRFEITTWGNPCKKIGPLISERTGWVKNRNGLRWG